MNNALTFSKLFEARQWASTTDIFTKALMSPSVSPKTWIEATFAAEQADLLETSGIIARQAVEFFPNNINILNLHPMWLMVNRRWMDVVAVYESSAFLVHRTPN